MLTKVKILTTANSLGITRLPQQSFVLVEALVRPYIHLQKLLLVISVVVVAGVFVILSPSNTDSRHNKSLYTL